MLAFAVRTAVKPLGFLKPSSLTKVASRFKAHQDSLPRLPVPPLQQTLDHYLKTLQPIVSEEEWAHTKQLVEEFQASGGVGERLQKGLERRAKKMENWMARPEIQEVSTAPSDTNETQDLQFGIEPGASAFLENAQWR